MAAPRQQLWAVIEVCLVFVLYRVILVPWVLPLITRDKVVLSFLNYAVMILLPILVILIKRQTLAEYGIWLRNFGYHAKVALDCFIPFALNGMLIGWLVPGWFPNADMRWEGTLIFILLSLALLYVLGIILQKRPVPPAAAALVLVFVPLAAVTNDLSGRVITFLFYVLFLGPGEEIFYRGYVQSRLNQVFGCPRRFYGASWGWGTLIAALLFGTMHIFNGYNPLSGSIHFSWWWGVWTAVGALPFAYLREKTGSVAAPAILHGLPQGIAALFGLFTLG
jgi:uncharacterized protein